MVAVGIRPRVCRRCGCLEAGPPAACGPALILGSAPRYQRGQKWPARRHPGGRMGLPPLGLTTSRLQSGIFRAHHRSKQQSVRTSIITACLAMRLRMAMPAIQPSGSLEAAWPGHQFSMAACITLCSRRTGRAGRLLGTQRLRTARTFRAPLTQTHKDHRADPSRRQLNRNPCTLRMGFRKAARRPRRGVQRLHPRARMVEGTDQLCLIGGATTP